MIPDFMNGVHTSYPGKIVTFNPYEQTATVTLAIEKYYSGIGTTNLYEIMPRIEIVDVPVQFPQCRDFCITMPVKPDDDCLVFFAHRGLSHWLYYGKDAAGLDSGSGWPNAPHEQKFDVNSALCIVGFNPIPRAIAHFNPDHLEIRSSDGSQRIILETDNSITVETTNDITLRTPATVILDTPLVKMTGDAEIAGNLAVVGTSTAADHSSDGISGKGHDHNYTTSAGSSVATTKPNG